jgi:hypothetical protein
LKRLRKMMRHYSSTKVLLVAAIISSATWAKPFAPTVSLIATPAAVAYNGSTTLKWASTNASSCQGSDNWTETVAVSGSKVLADLTSTENFTLTCNGGDEATASSQVTVIVAPPLLPTLSLTASQSILTAAGPVTLNWTADNASSCLASGGWSGTQAASGSYNITALTATNTFILTCSGIGGGAASQSITVAVPSAQGTVGASMGINLSAVNDWDDRQLTFVDVMKQARGFASLNNPWDPGKNPVPLDTNGWPTTDFGVYFITTTIDPLNRPLSASYPSMFGTYSLSFIGQARISSLGGNRIVNQVYDAPSNTTTAQVIVGATNTQLDLEFSNTHGGVRNLQLLRPGYSLGTTQVFTNQFLQAVTPFSTLRFMEFLKTNGNVVSAWSERKLPGDPIQNDPRGVAWEFAIQLANEANKDIWINIPQGVDLLDMTTNNYVTQLAALLKARLNPGLHIYVEYSNELWNTMFSQATANLNAAVMAVNSGVDATLNYDKINNQWYWSYRLAAHQIVRISQLFAKVYGLAAINTTIRPVYVSQDVQPFITEDSLAYIQKNFGDPAHYIYAIGGAPFFTAGNSDASLNTLFSTLQQGLNQYMPGFSGQTAYNGGTVYSGITFKSLAKYYGLKSVAYEGGPDLSLEASAVLAERAAEDPRISYLLQAELANFYGCGNDLFIYYKLAAPPGNGSVFGAYQDITVPTLKSAALLKVAETALSRYQVCTPAVNNQLYTQN